MPPAAAAVFGERLPLAIRYAELLAGPGVVRGAVGPREAARIWSRHVLNCAVVADEVSSGNQIVDIGSGAGLPGIPLALACPASSVVLVEPLHRRTVLLAEFLAELGLSDQVRVVRGRAEESDTQAAVGRTDVVLTRAVAPLDRVVRWCLPFARPTGTLLALKGASAAAELDSLRPQLPRLGLTNPAVVDCGEGVVEPPTRVVRLVRDGEVRKGRR